MTRSIVCFLLLSAVTFAQAPTTFEVASIRPSSEQVTQVSAGLRVAGSQVRVTGMSLKDYIGMAYGVKPQQIEGPDWLGQQRFDLAATIPAGGSAAQLGDMLQALLADRFKMTMHREKKEFPVYALGVAKGGAKIQPSAATPEAADREKAPEVNDVTLELAPEDYMPVMIRSAVNAGVVLPPQALRLLDGANADPFSNPLRNAGLTLESRKSPLDVIVVDAIAKTPTED